MAPGEALSSSQRSLLSRATSATSEPTPGYVYKDITDMVVRNLSILPAVEDYLLQKLTRPEPYVKFKCLKLLKNLCTRLPQEFNRSKVCQCYAVMECRSYRAPYSEYNGDYLCQMVRNEVEDLLKVVYENQNSTHSNGAPSQERMMGFGNAPPVMQSVSSNAGFGSNMGFAPSGIGSTSAYGNAPGHVKMEGFGNYVPPKSDSTSTGNMAFKLISDAAGKYLPTSLFSKIERVGSAITTTAMEQIEKRLSSSSDGHGHMPPTSYTTGFVNVDSNSSISSSQYHSQGIKMERSLLPSLIEDSNPQRSTVDDVSGDAEVKLVKEILTFSGIRVAPSQQIINDFLTRVKEVNMRYVVDDLLQNLNNRANKWQLQLRILCVFEALIMRAQMTSELLSHLRGELQPILAKCREDSQLRNKADRLIQLLGGDKQDSARSTDPFIMTSARMDEQASSKPNAIPLDLFSASNDMVNTGRTGLNVPSDFTNPAFDLMDSFTPVSSVPSPRDRKQEKPGKSDKEDDIFDFDKLTIAKAETKTTEKDLFAVLDNITFQSAPRKNEELI